MPEPNKTDQTPAVEELQKSLQAVKAENEKYQQLLNDPTMKEVLTKMANGEEIKFADPTAAPKTEPVSMKQKLGVKDKPADVDLNELSNKEFAGVISETLQEYITEVKDEANAEHQKEWQLMKNELTKTQDALLTISAQQQIKDVAAQNPDFDKYRPAMQELSQQYPQLAMQDLYKLAKADHVLKSPSPNTVETEKPESSSPFPEWQPSHLRSVETGDKEKSVGQSTTALRNRAGGRKDFLARANEAAGRLVNKSNMGG